MQNLRFDVDTDGIATITLDMPGRSMNVLNSSSIADVREAVEKVLSDLTIKGAVLTSGKPSFIAGADLDWLLALAEAEGSDLVRAATVYDAVMELHSITRRMETGGKPFVAAINGLSLGGGFELCLGCTRRIVADDERIQLGLPEAKVGLFPGGGGTQRLSRMLGPLRALELIVKGKAMTPSDACAIGLVDQIVPANEIIESAKSWILSSAAEDWIKPWDVKGFKAPGDDPRTLEGSLAFAAANARHRKNTYCNYPNLDALMKAVYDGLNVPLDTSLRIEARYFARMLVGDAARNMVRTQFVTLQKVSKFKRRPEHVPVRKVAKLGVLGSGKMGAGIAHVAARAGIRVVVIDRDQASAERVYEHVREVATGEAKRGNLYQPAVEEVLGRITATTDYSLLGDADLVIEAVFENKAVKDDVFQKAEAMLGEDAILASNTSTIPITSLSQMLWRPRNFIGMHFFSPVERMALLEIIVGEQTDPGTLAFAMDFARQIRKTPIVVNDSRGFYTSRVFLTYIAEACEMLMEGISPALIENAGLMAGMPVAPLALCDEVALDLIHSVNLQTANDLGRSHPANPAEALIMRMVEQEQRFGKKVGKGFYDYPAGKKKRLWDELVEIAPSRPEQPDVEALKQRLLVIQALEAVRCLEENVVVSPEDADVGAYLGWGFAPWTGGPISYIDTLGPENFVALCRKFELAHGKRFAPTPGLLQRATSGVRYYAPSALKAA
ncbi:3-hydroxyacyl-CoA dehydrogenase NAD-binding domain-containing protein [Chelativorans sp. Marseille-P2723]|uniref:3-hydroxyacyl-CoA dehydrogenase NAD-binding domain-containing protein n=1 Tax=Chelativorans sp. Marseille-P2723 TaxID=2709133 RepID=UPI00156E0F52|nr:3-hydroxyacyl-CoA dehydrogenase NAD-binding domain-containing protein [Chelativorans sp. Marseille-P2723]